MIGKFDPIIVSFGVGISLLTAFYLYKRSNARKWNHVGYLSEINFFPVKSCAVVRIDVVECKELGLKNGHFNDRTFMITDTNGNYLSGRSVPKLTQIKPSIKDKILTLSAVGLNDLVIDVDILEVAKNIIQCKIWNDLVNVIDCGEEAAKWVSNAILNKDSGMKLVYYPDEKSNRSIRKKFTVNPNMKRKYCGAFADGSSYMLASDSSLSDLNSRLENKQIKINQFRPNFVVKGAKPHDEDNWKMVKIGNNAIFEVVLPCTRCHFVNVDPDTGISNEGEEPLKTLKKYRQVNDRDLRKIIGESPKMGIQMGLRSQGKVKVGDPVYIIY